MHLELLSLDELLILAEDKSSNFPRIIVINLIKRCIEAERKLSAYNACHNSKTPNK